MRPLVNRPEDVGGAPDPNYASRATDKIDERDDWQRVAKSETAMVPLKNNREDVGGAVDPNFAVRDFDTMDP